MSYETENAQKILDTLYSNSVKKTENGQAQQSNKKDI